MSRRLMSELQESVQSAERWTGRAALSDKVISALKSVPRHLFVDAENIPLAYANRPLPIGYGQTISQPTVVAIMTDLLDIEQTDKVLEIGTGSGYQTAVLAELAGRVYSVEVVPELAAMAKKRLDQLGYENVEQFTAQGRDGWLEAAPFQVIMVTAAAEEFPEKLIEQLDRGGRMIIPIGPNGGSQNLIKIYKDQAGEVTEQQVLPVSFVPLVYK
ncbi:MAG: protein-L-isoaspartate(D-aspartate) O-methyltransferase [Rhodospirillaceae bacterium]|jgi:protein-L-isoaspartate(D-aspartate) O-methyltransferase|nr:protein-L-isoaspartate(D-aspartate) O-methyltransferase [Rhodospirillaceae bacterium]